MVAATMKISDYVVGIYNFQTGIANRSILVKKHCFIAKLISWPWEGAIQHKEFIIYNFITLDSISTGTTINEYCRNACASNMLIWTKFMTPYQNFVIPLKRRLSSGKRWKIICERNNSYYASVEDHQIRHVPWKAWLFKCLYILNMSVTS